MLILTRGIAETIVIGDLIHVMVVKIYGNRVQLGFEAPKSVPIHREEVYERIRMEKIHQHYGMVLAK